MSTENQTTPTKTLAQVEQAHVLAVLAECKGNKTKAAKLLDVALKTLYNKLAEYGVKEQHAHKQADAVPAKVAQPIEA